MKVDAYLFVRDSNQHLTKNGFKRDFIKMVASIREMVAYEK